MTREDAAKYLESYLLTMNGEYIEEIHIPTEAKFLADKVIHEYKR